MSVLPDLVVRNWRLKIAAFGLAVFLWVVVRAEPERTTAQTISNVPVVAQVSDLDWAVAGQPQPAVVEVRVSSPFGLLGPATQGLAVRVPIDEVYGRDTVVQLRRDWVVSEGEGNVQVRDIIPAQVRLVFEQVGRRAVPLSLRTVGELPEGLALAQPLSVNPAVARVSGPNERVGQLDSLALEPLDLSTVDGAGPVRLAVDTSGLSDLTFNPAAATVDIRLEEAAEQTYAGVPVVIDSLPAGLSDAERLTIEPGVLQVTLRGGRTRVAQTFTDELRAVVPSEALDGLRPGERRMVPIRIRGVPDLVSAFADVDSVRVTWQGAAADTAGAAAEPPDTANAGGGR